MRSYVRVRDGKFIGGVALGLAWYSGIDVRIVRIALTALAMLTTGGLVVVVLYLILMFTTPIVATPADLPSRE